MPGQNMVTKNPIVNNIVTVPVRSIVRVSNPPDKSQIEAELIQEILLLLTSLTSREKATIELIIDRLYDIGYVNLIDRKIRFRYLNSIAKLIAKTSKPIARIFAWRWFQKKCPQLIANWLYRKVKF
jgi:hypothetical protein